MNAKQLLCFLLVVNSPAMGQTTLDGTVQKMLADIPEPVQRLLIWPTSDIISHKSVSVTSTNVQGAILTASSWIRKTVDSKWLPATLDPICVSGEFEDRDVVRFKWSKEGRSFMIAQTANIFVVQISPAPEVQLDKIRDVALDVFAKTGRRWTGQLEEVHIPELNRAIGESSFDARRVKRITLQDTNVAVIVGRAQTLEETLALQMQQNDKNGDQNNKEIGGSFELPYWFEHVCWFADDKRVVFYFLKEDGGAAVRMYSGESVDKSWFK